MITERVQAIGTFSGSLHDDAPDSVARSVRVGDEIVITPARLDTSAVGAYSDAEIMASALYTGYVTSKPTPTTFQGYDLGMFLGTASGLGDLITTAVNPTNAAWTLAQWVSALRPSSLDAGTVRVGGATFAGPVGGYQWITPREALTDVCSALAAEWRVNPDSTLDADSISVLYPTSTTPVVVVTRDDEGWFGAYRGVLGEVLEAGLDIEEYTTSVIVVGQGSGSSMITAVASSGATTYQDHQGNNVVFERFIDAPSDGSTAAGVRAAAELAKSSEARRQFSVRTRTDQPVKAGDYLYAYDPAAGLSDAANQIDFRGRLLSVLKLRVFGVTWPVRPGMGVYCRHPVGASFIDLSDHWQYEDGEATLDVGQVPAILASASAPVTAGGGQGLRQTGAARLGVNPQIAARAAQSPGCLGVHSLTTAFNTSATHTAYQDEGLTLTINDVAGRRYKFTIAVNPYCPGGIQTIVYQLLRDGVQVRDWYCTAESMATAFAQGTTLTCTTLLSASASSVVYKVRIKATTANTQVSSYGDASTIRQFIIEDVGNI